MTGQMTTAPMYIHTRHILMLRHVNVTTFTTTTTHNNTMPQSANTQPHEGLQQQQQQHPWWTPTGIYHPPHALQHRTYMSTAPPHTPECTHAHHCACIAVLRRPTPPRPPAVALGSMAPSASPVDPCRNPLPALRKPHYKYAHTLSRLRRCQPQPTHEQSRALTLDWRKDGVRTREGREKRGTEGAEGRDAVVRRTPPSPPHIHLGMKVQHRRRTQ
ncbi:hypothetical protein K439DRAFT_1638652 [Ramaria rubella]|nr:hypothetical protein K439DRAFT_1638652 [Ramaria rubella]